MSLCHDLFPALLRVLFLALFCSAIYFAFFDFGSGFDIDGVVVK